MADKITTASAAWLTDPTVFAVNRTPAHSNHVTFSHIPAIGEPSDLKQSLDGEWRVEMVQASDIDLEEEPFAAEDFDDSAFDTSTCPPTCRTRDAEPQVRDVQYRGTARIRRGRTFRNQPCGTVSRTFTVAERRCGPSKWRLSASRSGMAPRSVWVTACSSAEKRLPDEFDHRRCTTAKTSWRRLF
ncbi:MAG: hypothetical protein ACLS6O_07340 [Bifidobacterium sp.]